MTLKEELESLCDYVELADGFSDFALVVGARIITEGTVRDTKTRIELTEEAIATFPLNEKDIENFLAYEAAAIGQLKLSRMAFAAKGFYLPAMVELLKETV